MSARFARHMIRLSRRTGGQSLVEMALVLPLLTVLLMGAVEFGLLLYAHVQVANAAREAARAASLYNSTRYITWADGSTVKNCNGSVAGWSLDQTIQQAIVNRGVATTGGSQGCPNSSGTIVYTSLGRLDPNAAFSATVTPAQSTYSNSAPTAGTTGTVTLVYPYQMPIVSRLVPVLGNTINIRKSVQYEYQP